MFDGVDGWRLSFVCDLKGESTSAKRFTFVFGDGGQEYRTAVGRFMELQRVGVSFGSIRDAFSVEALSREFYMRLYDWYHRALDPASGVSFPRNDGVGESEREGLNVKLIRLITRMLFVWFIKQKGLVPDCIFDAGYVGGVLVDFDGESLRGGNYYNGLLQNLFFATLNCPVVDEAGRGRGFVTGDKLETRNHYRDNDEKSGVGSMFKVGHDEVVRLFGGVPFLNGGLFECLDRFGSSDLSGVAGCDVRNDGFSRSCVRWGDGTYKYRAFVPDGLFFSTDEGRPGLITLFKEYNFTVEENAHNDAEVSLDPELLGRVFENLLADLNPETQVSARKSTGSFYTPREVVDFMVCESLIGYVSDEVAGLDRGCLEAVVYGDGDVDGDYWTSERRAAVCGALKRIRILDPACGSGAFPMGCLLRIVDVVERLSGGVADRYGLKLEVIENCIYGVDIQSTAMLICKLRFFISLVCEQGAPDLGRPGDNFGINTLPNLETKFVAADTLKRAALRRRGGLEVGIFDGEVVRYKDELLDVRRRHLTARNMREKKCLREKDRELRESIGRAMVRGVGGADAEKIAVWEKAWKRLNDEFKRLRVEYHELVVNPPAVQRDLFGGGETVVARGVDEKREREKYLEKRKREFGDKMGRLEIEIRRERAKGEGVAAAVHSELEGAVKQFADWNPYDQNAVCGFFDADWMFGVDGGVDVVLGNPPYVQLQVGGGELRRKYEKDGFESFDSMGDVYCLFYERGHELLRAGGRLCFITSNKWMRAGYGEKLRGFLSKRTYPVLLVDFAGTKVFESATVDTNVLMFVKGEANGGDTLCAVMSGLGKDGMRDLRGRVRSEGVRCGFTSSDSWVVLSPIEQRIKGKIEAVGTPLKDWDVRINRGILTGFNDAFIISTERREEILGACVDDDERRRTEELIRPILRGRDIKRYEYDWAGLWLIGTHNGVQGKMPRIDIEDYPAVKAHLDQYWDKISKRSDKGDTPYNLRNCAYWEDFGREKVVYPKTTQAANFAYIQDAMFIEDTCFMLISKDARFIQQILSSKLYEVAFKHFYTTVTLGKMGYQYNKIALMKLPIVKEYDRDRVYDDEAMYALYGLTKEEIAYIESI